MLQNLDICISFALTSERFALSSERVALSSERFALSSEGFALSSERFALSWERFALSSDRFLSLLCLARHRVALSVEKVSFVLSATLLARHSKNQFSIKGYGSISQLVLIISIPFDRKCPNKS